MSTAIDDQRELAATLIDRAGRVASDLGERAGAAEEQRHIHAESFRAMKEADLFRAYATVLNAQQRARIRLYGVHAMHMCREVVNILFQDSGGSALHERNRMQRYHRDINAMSMHEEIIKEGYGRLRLNLPTTHWLL